MFPHVTFAASILSMSRPVAGFEPATRYGLPTLAQAAPAAVLVDGPWPRRRPTTPADARIETGSARGIRRVTAGDRAARCKYHLGRVAGRRTAAAAPA